MDLNERKLMILPLVKLVKKEKKACILEYDIEYTTGLHQNHKEMQIFVKRIKIREVEKIVPSIKVKIMYVARIKNLNQALRHG